MVYKGLSSCLNGVKFYKGAVRRSMRGKVKTAGAFTEGGKRVVVASSTLKVARPTYEPRTDKVAVANRGMPDTEVKSKVVKVMW